jgi:hypothetical protein
MFWAFKLDFVIDILAFFDLATFWAIFGKIWLFFSYLLVTLMLSAITLNVVRQDLVMLSVLAPCTVPRVSLSPAVSQKTLPMLMSLYEPGAVFRILHFLHNLQLGPTS